MTIATGRFYTLMGILTSGLLLIAAASCSFDQATQETTQEQHVTAHPAEASAESHAYVRPAGSFMANPFCKACHVDFDEEQMVLQHKAAGIGCERCHGESLRHRSDEANLTPPELMYPKERINPTCMMCHPRHKIRHVDNHRPILEAGLSVFETQTPSAEGGHQAKYCTDCHGPHHQMNSRTIRWNKHTGELLQ